MLGGCVSLLEFHTEEITRHEVAPYEPQPTEQIVVSNYDELISVILGLVMEHESEAQIQFHYHDSEDVQAEIGRVRYELLNEHPIGVFALEDITLDVTRIVTHFEIDVSIDYSRTEEEVNSITNISTQRYMMTHLFRAMSQYNEETIIRTRLQFSIDDINKFVRETYYQNPRYIVMLPFVAVEVFPQEGIDRIFKIGFAYTATNQNQLPQMSEELTDSIQSRAELVEGDTDSAKLLSLINILIDSVEFNDGAMVHTHGAQNFDATAFGALMHGRAAGEGFAMAFQAIAEEIGLDSRIVLGYFEGRVHAWNIVQLYGEYYHVDVAMARVHGIETAILKRDVDFEEMMYTWDMENTVACVGELTLEDIMIPYIEDEPYDIVDNDDVNNEEEG